MPVFGQKSAIMDFLFGNFYPSATQLKCTKLTKVKPGDLQQHWGKLGQKPSNLPKKCTFLGKNPPLWIFFQNFFSDCKILQPSGQNETKIKSIPPPNAELWPKRFAIFEKSKNFGPKNGFLAAILEHVVGSVKKCLVHYAVTYRTCGENFSPIRPASPEKSVEGRTDFAKVIQLVGITSGRARRKREMTPFNVLSD